MPDLFRRRGQIQRNFLILSVGLGIYWSDWLIVELDMQAFRQLAVGLILLACLRLALVLRLSREQQKSCAAGLLCLRRHLFCKHAAEHRDDFVHAADRSVDVAESADRDRDACSAAPLPSARIHGTDIRRGPRYLISPSRQRSGSSDSPI